MVYFQCISRPKTATTMGNPELMPNSDDPLRYSPIMGVVLTNADVDHTAGLINLKDPKNLVFMQLKEYWTY